MPHVLVPNEYSDNAKLIMREAGRISIYFGQEFLGTHHVLLAFMHIGDNVLSTLLHERTVFIHHIEHKIDTVLGRSNCVHAPGAMIPWSSMLIKFDSAARMSRAERNRTHVGTCDLSRALLSNPMFHARRFLDDLKVNCDELIVELDKDHRPSLASI